MFLECLLIDTIMSRRVLLIVFVVISVIMSSCQPQKGRKTVSLSGEWELAKTCGEIPIEYSSRVSVPGLVDLSYPAVDTVGGMYTDSSWYWYKRTFEIDNFDYEIIRLKINKAKYHTKVYVNGKFVGENLYCFTPSYLDIKPYLKKEYGQQNEVVIGVGTKPALPDTIPDGHDYEKLRYIPGIYDNVELIVSNKPFIKNVQCVPNIRDEKLIVHVELEVDEPISEVELNYNVNEVKSKKTFKSAKVLLPVKVEGDIVKGCFDIDMKDAHLWSPESPFLYNLMLSTRADDYSCRFGMRTFRFDPERKVALLNEKPYYLRGTNVCIFRFFEDPERSALPWNDEWVLKLHDRFKDVGWNSMRYCIGFPPERWYEICDSLGILLQDEYPLWYIKDSVKAEHLAQEYKLWMRERWNHASVVIWDAQNECVTPETGKAISMVRSFDLSNRPWDNGWSKPQADSDPSEAHPYPLLPYKDAGFKVPKEGYKKATMGKKTIEGTNFKNNPVIINEYGWLWLNRDGSPTTLTEGVYDLLWDGRSLTSKKRFEIYARNLAMFTESYRASRLYAGVLQFCGLSYSRVTEPRGETSDNWIDLPNLVLQPDFVKYLKSAFAPVGLMLDTWEKVYPRGAKIEVPLFVTNDLYKDFVNEVTIELLDGDNILTSQKVPVNVSALGIHKYMVNIKLPEKKGSYLLKASYVNENNEHVFSFRDIVI